MFEVTTVEIRRRSTAIVTGLTQSHLIIAKDSLPELHNADPARPSGARRAATPSSSVDDDDMATDLRACRLNSTVNATAY